jgi:hypothetical protein
MKTNTPLAILLAIVLASCINDKGNYTYLTREQVMPLHVTNINKEYSLLAGQPFTLAPVVEGIDDPQNHEYLWCIYGVGLNRTGQKDTIGRQPALDYRVNLPSGTYQITYTITNKTTNLRVSTNIGIRVITDFSSGWFITKDQDNITDIDLVNDEGRTFTNLIQSLNGSGIPGKAIKTTYVPGGYNYVQNNPDGTVTPLNNQKIFFVITETELAVISADNIKRYATFDQSFYETPDTKAPRDVLVGSTCANLLNNGKLHEMPIAYANAARFGAPLIGSADIAPYFFRHTARGYLAFDRQTSTFMVSTFWQPSLRPLTDEPTSIIPSNNMEHDLLYMQEQAAYYTLTRRGLALFKHRPTGTYHGAILDDNWMNYKNPIITFVQVPDASAGITTATIRAVNNINDVLYYSDGGNTIGLYNITNGLEKPAIITYQPGETIAAIEHVTYHVTINATPSPDCLAVLTNKDNKWTLHLHHFIGYTADVEKTPYQTYTGDGNARDILYRAPNSPATN